MDQIKAWELMAELGIILDNSPADRKKFAALQKLIAGAIFDWADAKDDVGEDGATEESIMDELEEFAQEWLVG